MRNTMQWLICQVRWTKLSKNIAQPIRHLQVWTRQRQQNYISLWDFLTFYFKIIFNLQKSIKKYKELPYILFWGSLLLRYCDIYCIFWITWEWQRVSPWPRSNEDPLNFFSSRLSDFHVRFCIFNINKNPTKSVYPFSVSDPFPHLSPSHRGCLMMTLACLQQDSC